MTTDTAVRAADLAASLAASIAEFLAPDGTLGIGEALALPIELPLTAAVRAPIGGAITGELALFVDDTFAAALTNSDLGQLELSDALQPVLATLADRFGGVQLGGAIAVDATSALDRLESRPDAAVIVLGDGAEIRAAVAVGTTPAVEPPPLRAVGSAGATRTERLDLLRSVEMAATVELGRAKMTINDLLSLRDGAVIELDRAAGDAADLYVNGRLLAHGEIVVVDENYALRVTQIVPDESGH